MPEAQSQPVPEDETFLSEDDIVDEYLKEKHGIEPEAEPAAEAADEGESAPERDASSDEGELLPGESSERGDEPAAEEGEETIVSDEPEWLKELPEEAKTAYLQQQKELASLRENYNAVHNRLAPVQQENARLRQRLAGENQRPEQTQDSRGTPVGQTNFSLSDVEEFKEYREAFPEEAKALEAVFARQQQHVAHLQQQLGNVSQGLQSMQQASFASQREAELARLSEAHPDWATVRPSDDFKDWLEVQPPSIAQLADSPSADDCIWILDRYKADAYMAQQFLNQQDEQPAQQESRTPSRAQQTRQRRQQIRGVPTPPSQQDGGVGAPQAGGVPMSDEEIWEAEVERRLKAQRQANR